MDFVVQIQHFVVCCDCSP